MSIKQIDFCCQSDTYTDVDIFHEAIFGWFPPSSRYQCFCNTTSIQIQIYLYSFIFFAFQAWHPWQKEKWAIQNALHPWLPNHVYEIYVSHQSVPLLSQFIWHLPLCIFNQVVFTLLPFSVEQYMTSWSNVKYKSWHTSPNLNNTKLNGSEIITIRGKLPINFGWIVIILFRYKLLDKYPYKITRSIPHNLKILEELEDIHGRNLNFDVE